MRATILIGAGRVQEAIAAAFTVLQGADAGQIVCVRAAVVAGLALAVAGRVNDVVLLADRWAGPAQDLAQEMPFELLGPEGNKSFALCLAGWLLEAKAIADEGHRRLVSLRAEESVALCATNLGLIALGRGRVATAARWLREAVAPLRGPARADFLPGVLAVLARALVQTGDLTAGREALAEAEETLCPATAVFEPHVILAQAWVASGHGEMSRARALALEAADKAEAQGQHAIAVVALHDLTRFDDPRPSRLETLASRVEGPFAPACALYAGALAAGDGPRLDEAAAAFAAMGADLLAAEAWGQAAAAHRAAGRKAAMFASSARGESHLEACEGARSAALAALAVPPLTRREREVAMLAETGLTSAQIGERLRLSRRTVEGHLQRAYAKLGIASRSELRSVLGRPRHGDDGDSPNGLS